MARRARTHLLLVFLLALGGLGGAAGAYRAFGPSAPSDQLVSHTLVGVGHARVGSVDPASYSSHPTSRPRSPNGEPGAGTDRVGVRKHAHSHRHGRPHHGSGHAPKPTPPGPSPIPGPHDRFAVTVGDVDGLYPGRNAGLPVTYTNPNPFAVSVTTVVVDTTGTKTCGRRYFVTGSYPQVDPVRVPGRSTISATALFGMKLAAPNACQGVAVRVDVTATAVKR